MIIEPIPRNPTDPIACISKAKVLEQCRYITNPAPDWLEIFYRQLARRNSNVWSANFDNLVCPYLPICDPVVNGQLVKSDRAHLTPKFAKTLGPFIENYLKQNGIIPS